MTTTNKLDFFFDFLSPFAYLAHQKLPAIARKYGYHVRYVPIDLPRAKRAAGNTGPSNREIPAKLRYMTADMNRWAQRYGVQLAFPKSFNSDRMNKGTFFAEDRGQTQDYVTTAYASAWGRGEDMSDVGVLAAVARKMKWPESDFIAYVESDEVIERYEAANLEAHRRGVFGVPAMLIGDEMWWGNDRLQFLEEFLKEQPDSAA